MNNSLLIYDTNFKIWLTPLSIGYNEKKEEKKEKTVIWLYGESFFSAVVQLSFPDKMF